MEDILEEDNEKIALEAILSRIRNLINMNKIKLWLEPYYIKDNGPNESALLQTATSLAPELELDDLIVYQGLIKLQGNAIEKLKARDILVQSGLIELKLKPDRHLRKQDNVIAIQIDNNETGDELANLVSTTFGCSKDKFKLVSGGSVIKPNARLSHLGFKPGQTVMVLTVDHNCNDVLVVEEQRRILDTAKEDAEILSDKDEMTITDQNGKQVELPKEEKKSMIMAMSLHDKGKGAMKRSNYALAIVLLLEAKEEYNKCRSELLEVVDNYGLLNLDIAWCYLRLGNLSELPNAQERLKECETSFKKSYGQNLERLEALKGSSSNETVLYMRLHLLQAICAFISGLQSQARSLLSQANHELKQLKVPEEALEEVVAQGFSPREARLALRATRHCPTLAVKYAHEAKLKRERMAKEEEERNEKRKSLGKTVNGSWVNLGYLKTLVKMGYEEELAARALRHTDNDMNQAIEVMNDNPELLLSNFGDEDDSEEKVTKDMIDSITSMGFDPKAAKAALKNCKGNIGRAVDLLTKNPEIIDTILSQADSDKQKTKDAKKRMQEDMVGEEDHLDVTLEEESAYLDQYKKLMGM